MQRLPRANRVKLSIYLRLGSEPGEYEIELLRNRTDTEPLAKFVGTAQIENGLTVIRIDADFSMFEAGIYAIAIRRRPEGSWRYLMVRLG
jgi:hypothetical protein